MRKGTLTGGITLLVMGSTGLVISSHYHYFTQPLFIIGNQSFSLNQTIAQFNIRQTESGIGIIISGIIAITGIALTVFGARREPKQRI